MRDERSQHRRRRTALVAAAAAALLLLPGSFGAAPAALAVPAAPTAPAVRATAAPAAPAAPADPVARATALRQQVEALEEEVERAAEEHAEASGALTATVSAELDAQRQLDARRAALEAERDRAGRRARAVQQAGGGRLALAVGVLRGQAPADVLDRSRAVAAVLGSDARAVTGARATVDDAVAAASRVVALRAEAQQLEQRAADADARARDALAARQALLASADAAVAAAAQAQRDAAEAAADASAASGLAALGADPSLQAPPSGAVATAITAATSRLGVPYVWGATGPDAFDCSGLVQWAYAQAGVRIPRTTRQQYAGLPRVPVADLRPGDLVLYADGGPEADPSTIHHVGLYVGGGRMVHAPHTGDVVRVAAVTRSAVYAVVRPVADPAP